MGLPKKLTEQQMRFAYELVTNEGRKRLAANNGTFRIVQFSFGDDEVDYNIIQKYGRTVGREKIEKNGFKTAANFYSISSTANFGGRIGLVNENNFSGDAPNKISLPFLFQTYLHVLGLSLIHI